jgi:hypothetical protein
MAERPNPELPMPVPVTRHHVFLTLPILNTPYSILSCLPVSPCCPLYVRLIHFLHLCTGRRPTCTFARCVSARASRLSLALSPCHHAHVPPRDLRSRPCQPVNLPTCQLVVRSDPPSLWASGPLTCIAVSLVNVSTCQHAPSWRFAPSCPLAATPRSPLHLCTGAPLRFAPLHGLSLVHRASEPPGL